MGVLPARGASPEVSYKELVFAAAQQAYADAGVRFDEIQSFVTCAEDFNEGTSIFDEYTPDQLGAVQKPMHTVGGDGLHGLADAAMQVMTGLFDLVVVEAHSKASNILTPDWILDYAMDPIFQRPLGLNPHFVAGLEMSRFLAAGGAAREACAEAAARNARAALANPWAAYGASRTARDVLESPPAFDPLCELEMAAPADGAAVFVVASEERARGKRAVWIRGVGWENDSPTLESRDWVGAPYARGAARRAFRAAGIGDPSREIDLFEIDDTYAYKQLQHLRAIGVEPSERVNVSGGSIGVGHLLEASGLYRAAELVAQLRGEAGARQVKGARTGLAFGWRGVPTTSGAAVVLGG
jgi:acetyl-CoA C-acetyltransferase